MNEPLLVNKDKLAELLGCSLPTVSALIKRYAEFPVVQRGGLGVEWKFDPQAVVEFLQARRAEEESQRLERDEQLAQLRLPSLFRDEPGGKVSIDDQLKAARLRQIEREELKEAGFLVPTHEIRAALERMIRRYAQIQESAVQRVCAAHNLPEAVRRAMAREFDEARAAFVQEMMARVSPGEEDHEPRTLFG
ncbi:terminase small subunit [Acidocella sp.]|uniref:terminase small subunit n=1 Tax=Acidocella sp. TaxID=50710 RepID=UPI00262C3126|nr:terminase small subunit [Acidocella sp.]